jgi:glycosyltransferase involved in cell wall biosynthesis
MPEHSLPVILVSAYAVNPYKGSEEGMGWNGLLQMARYQQVVAFTRSNNRLSIERYQEAHPELNELYARIRFEYFDYPKWFRWWKKGPLLALVYFYGWQMALPLVVWKRRIHFDIAHHFNFHSDWMPSFLWILGKPFVWGPIAHHPLIPRDFLKPYGRKAWMADRWLWLMKQYFWKLDPFLWLTRRKALCILAANEAAGATTGYPEKVRIVPSVACEPMPAREQTDNRQFMTLSVGRFVPLKGFDVAIEAFARFYKALEASQQPQVSLRLVGSGPCQPLLEALVQKYQMEEAVQFIPWLPRQELAAIYQQASVFLFPSHEGAGMVVAEAMSHGLPVLCFDNDGPGAFVAKESALKIPYGGYEACIAAFSEKLMQLFENPTFCKQESVLALTRYQSDFCWEQRGESYRQSYLSILLHDENGCRTSL